MSRHDEGDDPKPSRGRYEGPEVLHDSHEELAQQLAQLVTNGINGGFLVAAAPNGSYVQFLNVRDDGGLIWECASNEYLPPEAQLGADQIAQLLQLGFGTPDPNFRRDLPWVPDLPIEPLARECCSILTRIYGCDPHAALEFTLELNG